MIGSHERKRTKELLALSFIKAEYQGPRTKLKLIKRAVCFDISKVRVPSTKNHNNGEKSSDRKSPTLNSHKK
jgi:hypothetical protein